MRTGQIIGARLASGEEIFLGARSWPSSPFAESEESYIQQIETVMGPPSVLLIEVMMSTGFSVMMPADSVIFAEGPGLVWVEGRQISGPPDGLMWHQSDGKIARVAWQHLGRFFKAWHQPEDHEDS